MRTGVEIKTKKAAGNFVTQADKKLDVLVGALLAEKIPDCADFSGNSALADGLISQERVEKLPPATALAIAARHRVWYLDPIDGIDNYVKQDGQYVVLLGLVIDRQPVYGWIYAPARDELYFGGPDSGIAHQFSHAGVWRQAASTQPELLAGSRPTDKASPPELLRLIMGSRDRRAYPDLVACLEPARWVKVGSLGLKVMAVIQGEADAYIHVSQQLKFWDAAAPVGLVQAAGLTVCNLEGRPLDFTPHAEAVGEEIFRHRQTVLIGTSQGVAEVRCRLDRG